MKFHVYGSEIQYTDHLRVVWAELGPYQGQCWFRGRAGVVEGFQLIPFAPADFERWAKENPPGEDYWLVASYQDLCALHQLRHKNLVLMEHGTGQTYVGVTDDSYISANRTRLCKALWMPNQRATALQQSPTKTPVYQLPPYRVNYLQGLRRQKKPNTKPVVVVSFHYHGSGCPEQRATAQDWWDNGVLAHLAQLDTIQLVGHSHPRCLGDLQKTWASLGVPCLSRFDDVVTQADLYICDNSSTLFEAAACGIPVILLNGLRYRPSVRHGLRFWNYADMGLQVWAKNSNPTQAVESAIYKTLQEDPQKIRREQIVQELFSGGTPVQEIIQKMLGRETEDTPMAHDEIWARSLRSEVLRMEGDIRANQLFRPGWFHVQRDGKAFPLTQVHKNPAARRNLLASSQFCLVADAFEVSPAPAPDVFTLPVVLGRSEPDPKPVESEKPDEEESHGPQNPDSDPSPVFDDGGGLAAPPETELESVRHATPAKSGRRKVQGGLLLQQPLPND